MWPIFAVGSVCDHHEETVSFVQRADKEVALRLARWGAKMTDNIKVCANPIYGVVIHGRQCNATEAICPVCGTTNMYRHLDSHYSDGIWYACEHLVAHTWGDSAMIDAAEFSAAGRPH